MEEQELISLSQKGDLQAFNRLVESYQSLVYNLSLRMLGDGSAAEDIAQETFIAAFRGINSFKGGNFKAWLLRIASNACIDQLRSRKRRPTTSLDSFIEETGDIFPSPEDPPEQIAISRETMRDIQRGLATLPEEQRLAILLSDVHGYSYEEIAEITKSSLGTVKSRLSRGRANLRDYLLQHSELLPQRFRYRE